MFTLDGQNYDNVVTITKLRQKFTILNGNNSGRLQSGDMYLEKLGTFINYEMTVQKNQSATNQQWDGFVNVLMNPDNKHTITLPSFQRLESYDIYVADGGRDLIRTNLSGTDSIWGDLTLEFVSMRPINWTNNYYR